jgi:hypothetical protein
VLITIKVLVDRFQLPLIAAEQLHQAKAQNPCAGPQPAAAFTGSVSQTSLHVHEMCMPVAFHKLLTSNATTRHHIQQHLLLPLRMSQLTVRCNDAAAR